MAVRQGAPHRLDLVFVERQRRAIDGGRRPAVESATSNCGTALAGCGSVGARETRRNSSWMPMRGAVVARRLGSSGG
jgi:hypothetical protein